MTFVSVPALSIPSLISAYAEEEESPLMQICKEVDELWDKVWQEATSERFVDWLVNERIIDFKGPGAKTEGVHLFSRHIRPLLLDAASTPQERELLYTLGRHLKFSNRFLTIIPKFGRTSADDGRSYTCRAVQGVPASLVPGRPTAETVTEESLEIFLQSIDSFAVELLLDSPRLELLEDATGAWHLGSTADRSSLLHELTHVWDMVTETPEPTGAKSYRWTRPEEERTIERENAFLRGRKEKVRVSHSAACTVEMHMEQSCTLRLVDAFLLAADGTARILIEEGLMAPEGSPKRIELDEKHLKTYAKAYLMLFMQVQSNEIDLAYRNELIFHKNVALDHLVTTLVEKHPEGKKMASRVLELVVEEAPGFGRQDAIEFAQNLRNSL